MILVRLFLKGSRRTASPVFGVLDEHASLVSNPLRLDQNKIGWLLNQDCGNGRFEKSRLNSSILDLEMNCERCEMT